jgi:hypothetical protein
MAKSDLLLDSLARFFDDPRHLEQLSDILTHRKGISLRNLEWFVTNYSKKQHVTYQTPAGRSFTVHVAYKSSLDGYSKKLFDPFCRTERIEFQGFTTTCAQLNFLRWCIQNGIIEYMLTSKVNTGHLQCEASHIHNKTDLGKSLQQSVARTHQEI